MEKQWQLYGKWLIRVNKIYKTGYTNLLDVLHEVDFQWVLPKDRNRAEDGLYKRLLYEDEYKVDFQGRPCSVLEMLVSLANRVDSEYIGSPSDPRPDLFFWEMLENLSLDHYTNRYFDRSSHAEAEILDILKVWMGRDFRKNGVGSPFPLTNDRRDQRKREIWDQMNAYLYENFQ